MSILGRRLVSLAACVASSWVVVQLLSVSHRKDAKLQDVGVTMTTVETNDVETLLMVGLVNKDLLETRLCLLLSR